MQVCAKAFTMFAKVMPLAGVVDTAPLRVRQSMSGMSVISASSHK